MARTKRSKPGSGRRHLEHQKASPIASHHPQEPLPPSDDTSKTLPQPDNVEPPDHVGTDPPPAKRQKTASSIAEKPMEEVSIIPRDRFPTFYRTPQRMLPSELRHLQHKYAFAKMSIVTSSKMEQKIRTLLLRTRALQENEPQSQPGVVVLTAKAHVAQKMVGIVEIAKRAIEKEGGQWWQYNKIHGQMIELRKKGEKPKQAEGGKMLFGREKERTQVESDTVAEATQGEDANCQLSAEMSEHEDEEDEAAFQTMGEHQVMAYKGDRSKLRAIPVMTIHLSQVPVPELKTYCDEQSNATK